MGVEREEVFKGFRRWIRGCVKVFDMFADVTCGSTLSAQPEIIRLLRVTGTSFQAGCCEGFHEPENAWYAVLYAYLCYHSYTLGLAIRGAPVRGQAHSTWRVWLSEMPGLGESIFCAAISDENDKWEETKTN